MKFSEQAVFRYDPDEFYGATIDQLLNLGGRGDMDGFKLGGLADFREVFMILREYYSNYPLLSVKELRTNTGENPIEIDDLWNEPAALKLEFNRLLKMRAKLELGKESAKHEKQGLSKVYDLAIYTGIPVLYDLDYWPRIGDEFVWRGILHSVSHVLIDPKCYFQNSGLPLHVTMKAIIKQSDGSIHHQQNLAAMVSAEESGRPTSQQPESPVETITAGFDDGF